MPKTYNFSACAIDYGNYDADTQQAAQDKFAADAGYQTWKAMVERAAEFGGNNVEVREVLGNSQLSEPLECA